MADQETRDVLDFHEKFDLPVGREGPKDVDSTILQKRIDFIESEFTELKDARIAGKFDEMIDALVDMTYVIKGTAVILGISPSCWEDLWDEVHKQNMLKELTAADDFHFGIAKPEGWVKPDIQSILDGYGARFKK